MSVDLSQLSAQQYIGVPYAKVMKFGVGLYCVPLKFSWVVYGAGDTNQNIAVKINLAGTTNQPRQLLQTIKSIYIDNTGSPVPIYVQFADTGFTAIAQPYSAGWYPVFTNEFEFTVAGLGFTSLQIPTTQIFVTNVPVSPYTDAALQTVLPYYLSSPSIGGGAPLGSITPVLAGQDYANGGLAITGGGGNGAQAQGTLDQFGRFVSVAITNPGTGYTGIPVITPTAANPSPPVYNQGTNYAVGSHVVFTGIEYLWNGSITIQTGAAAWGGRTAYNAGNQANYLGNIFTCTQNVTIPFQGSNPFPPNDPTHWQFVGTAQPNSSGNWLSSGTEPATTATFTATLAVTQKPIISSGLALPALGDQAQGISFALAGVGLIQNNLWGTPFNSGFIYLTHLNIESLNLPGATFSISNLQGYTPFVFTCPTNPGPICDIQKANIKLDATQTWQLKCTVGGGANISIQVNWVWTWAAI